MAKTCVLFGRKICILPLFRQTEHYFTNLNDCETFQIGLLVLKERLFFTLLWKAYGRGGGAFLLFEWSNSGGGGSLEPHYFQSVILFCNFTFWGQTTQMIKTDTMSCNTKGGGGLIHLIYTSCHLLQPPTPGIKNNGPLFISATIFY